MNKLKFLAIILAISVVANIYLASQFVLLKIDLMGVEQTARIQETSRKALFFTELFVDKVLAGKGEVSFEDRLKLENAVRDIDDENILLRWQDFVNSKTDTEAQLKAGQLLSSLLSKISR